MPGLKDWIHSSNTRRTGWCLGSARSVSTARARPSGRLPWGILNPRFGRQHALHAEDVLYQITTIAKIKPMGAIALTGFEQR